MDLNFYEKDLSDFDFKLSISKWNPGSVQFFLENYKDNVLLADSGGNFILMEFKKLIFIQILNLRIRLDLLEIYTFIKIKYSFLIAIF